MSAADTFLAPAARAASSDGWPSWEDALADWGAAPPFHAPGIGDDSWPAWSVFLLSLVPPEPVTLARIELNRLVVGLFDAPDTFVLMGVGFGVDERAGSAAALDGVFSLFLDPQAFGGGTETSDPEDLSVAAGV